MTARHHASAREPAARPAESAAATASRKAALQATCQEILTSEEGIARLRREILEGSSRAFWRAVDMAFGKASKTEEPEPEPEEDIGPIVDGLSENAQNFLARLAELRHEQTWKAAHSRPGDGNDVRVDPANAPDRLKRPLKEE